MKLCLASTSGRKKLIKNNLKDLRFVLESFFYVEPWQEEEIKDVEFFMLDSGAFTFLNSGKNVDIEKYVEGYIDFINRHDIKYFFELDIDSVVGYNEVKRIRRKIERRTKKRCIPVWHRSRGIQDFKEMCKKYDYVAIGGIVTKEIPVREHFLLNAFCDYAHEQNCKIHALGFTPANLEKYRFDSVDSASWKFGGIYGKLYEFSNGKMTTYKSEKRLEIAEYDTHNIKQFKLFQNYLHQLNLQK
jgi:hypothetical protein